MYSLLILQATILGFASAILPVWFHNGQCGISKYEDAGEYFLPNPKSSMIVGGIEPRNNEFPWLVSIRATWSGKQFCGGSIINDKWILTAAHCLNGLITPSEIYAVAGDHQISDYDSTTRQLIQIQKAIRHDKYNSKTLVNDVALLKAEKPIKLNDNVWPVCAADPNQSYAHVKAQVAGWGYLNMSWGAHSEDILKYTTLNITTNKYCNDRYYKQNKQITDDMICATDNLGGRTRDSCKGDSGGPLTVKESNGQFHVVGAVSWGYSCAEQFPGVYSRIGYQSSWITNTINKF